MAQKLQFLDNRILRRGPLIGALKIVLISIILTEVAMHIVYGFILKSDTDMTIHYVVGAFIGAFVSYPIGYYILKQREDLQILSERLQWKATTDQMTGLSNRSSFFADIEPLLNTPKAGATSGSFLFVDVDHFKKVNDRFGHAAGDRVIKLVGDVLREFGETGAVSGRIGGEEFGVFIPNANKSAAISVAENIRRKVRKIALKNESHELVMSVSIGISMHKAGQTLSDFVQKADECLYEAKSAGRNRIFFEDLAQQAGLAVENGFSTTRQMA